MSNEAFCYFGLLRGRESFERILQLVPHERQQAVRAVMENCAAVPDAELRNRLDGIRCAESAELWRQALPPGVGPGRLSPVLRQWLKWKARSLNERQDHQG